jgi:intein/homing endonuclease
MADHTTKNIQDFKVGDTVISYDLEQKKQVIDTVKEVIVNRDIPGGYMTINHTLRITGNHRVWVNDAWARADTLKKGDMILSPKGKEIKVEAVDKVNGVNTVYNVHLEGDNHNFFADRILVHNASGGLSENC